MDQRITVKSFPAEMYGERVGWVSVQVPPGRDDILTVGLAVATVSEEGASYGYTVYDHGEKQHRFPADEGFLAVSSLFMILDKDQTSDSSTQFYFSSIGGSGKAESIMHTAGGYGDLTPNDEDKHWRDNPIDLLDALKEGLQFKNMSRLYPEVYYTINMRIANDKNFGSNVVDRSRLMIADPKMAEETSKEMAESLRIATLIKDVIDIDKMMAQELTVFSSLQSDEVPEVFAHTRRMVASKEAQARQAAQAISSRMAVYKPIGFRPNGRSWPYMDPEEPDETKSFGFVLNDLQNRRITLANNELEREVSEAAKRLEYAKNGVAMLGALAVAEREALQASIGSC